MSLITRYKLVYNRLLHLLVNLSLILHVSAYMVGNDPNHRIEVLDSRGKYQLEWKVNFNEKQIIFNVTAKSKGYVGFGLSSNGKMTGADIVIGGVLPSGQSYFSDYHAVGRQIPVKDPSQDWTLLSAEETDSYTFLSFSRAFDTCDPQDYPITENKISLIWAYGERDELAYHYQTRGEYPVYLLHPDYSPPTVHNRNIGAQDPVKNEGTKGFQVWTVNSQMTLPAVDTTYWCTIHKAPTRFGNEQTRNHVHHWILYKCHAPQGRTSSEMFSPFLHHRGQQCLSVKAPTGPLPTEYCTEMFQAWAIGGRPVFYPPHVGAPFAEDSEEYYVLQVHYDNVNKLENVQIDLFIDIYYTSELRRNDAGVMVYRHESPGVTPSLLIPPSTPEHKIYGFCGSQCTREMLAPEGIRIFGLNMHAHNTGVGMRFQHFRGNRELPWIESDNNYAFNYQQIRMLNKEVKVLPGDFLVAQCTYDNTRVNGTVVGGYSSQQEMCAVFSYYYNKNANYVQCSSEIESEEARHRFLGIGNVTWSNREVEFIVDSPDPLAGMRVSQVSDNYVEWNVERREELQRFHLEEPHRNRCPRESYSLPESVGYRRLSSGRSENEEDEQWRTVAYPYQAKPYTPHLSCSFK